ncbi:glycosyltransferase family 61 protein [Oidiodendron maius Zn]|uniref:EGF domain-specific O-linked N-acetylglucosamine transferase n=1 Tax=Oidiodendron maius (strain Zn) TaxID=913774 RepID=A0A0C3HSH2_OIDMZ|nr:glycosyltransferase family 61 protein [Oidiodendron maius Zn]
MVLLKVFHQKRIRALGLLICAIVLALMLLYPVSRLYLSHQISKLPIPWPLLPSSPSSPLSPAVNRQPFDLPPEYSFVPPQSPNCIRRFSAKYIEELRDHAVSYCSPDSRSNITCFHSHAREDEADSFCFGRGVAFDASKSKFSLDCSIRDLTTEEEGGGLVPFGSIRGYWYNTGPPNVFNHAIEIHQAAAHEAPPQTFLLLQREGETNTWHSLLEIFSTWITFDVLRMSGDASRDNEAFFRVPEDILDTQVVILDDRKDGPYFDLWTLFAQRKPLRLEELAGDQAAIAAIQNANIIVPLAGSSNPLWQPDSEVQQCTIAPTVSVFSRRVLEFYKVPDPPVRQPDEPIVVTFIDRKTRRLQNQTTLFEELQKRNPYIVVRLIDFAAIPFSEQLRVTRETDVLVGVHGAGLTHSIFMREGAGAVVEIQPQGLEHYGFRMVATMRGLSYFHVHAASKSHDLQRRDGWHLNDVHIEPERFMDIMEVAIKTMYSKGLWNFDVN